VISQLAPRPNCTGVSTGAAHPPQVRLNSAQYLADKLEELEAAVRRRWRADAGAGAQGGDAAAAGDQWSDGLFEGASQQAQQCIRDLCAFVAMKVRPTGAREPGGCAG
jgi:hypothetical protein